MTTVPRDRLRESMGEVLAAQSKALPANDDAQAGRHRLPLARLQRVSPSGWRTRSTRSLNFDAAGLRQITTVGDVLDLLLEIQDA
ncbi:acyl carrier protein [Nocardioides convexus]|uniref:acyl carrier protein n=1 Tax=Nocardioides convexus TaxID=2712224 RepID=UPI0024185FF2|nr:acyl carrier protein [Nocardioides convexus]